jgi:NAD-dependent dihydropyrimidine dehydrogenase PreA subunit
MIKFDDNKCTGCAVCVNVCPQAVIGMKDRKAFMTDYESCMECGACELNCEFGAVKVTKGTGCLFAILKEDILKMTPKGTGCGCADENTSKGCGC